MSIFKLFKICQRTHLF